MSPAKGTEGVTIAAVLPLADGGTVAAGDTSLAASPQPSDGAVPNKRRRITGKGGVGRTVLAMESTPQEGTPAAQLDAEDAKFVEYLAVMAWPAEDAWRSMPLRLQRGLAWEKVKSSWCKMRAQALKGAQEGTKCKHSGGWQNVWKDARMLFTALSSARRRALLDCMLEVTKAPEWVLSSLLVGDSSVHTRKKVQSALYTWVSKRWELPPAAAKGRDVEVAISVARRVGWVKKCTTRSFGSWPA